MRTNWCGIDNYKNLRNLTIDFRAGTTLITVVIGRHGRVIQRSRGR